jgi:hypothetical protein
MVPGGTGDTAAAGNGAHSTRTQREVRDLVNSLTYETSGNTRPTTSGQQTQHIQQPAVSNGSSRSDQKRNGEDEAQEDRTSGGSRRFMRELAAANKEIDSLRAELIALRTVHGSRGSCEVVAEALKEREEEILFLRRRLRATEHELNQSRARLQHSELSRLEIQEDLKQLLSQRGRVQQLKEELLAIEHQNSHNHRSQSNQPLEFIGN